MPQLEPPPDRSVRRLKRSEYERLAELGAFENEQVELLDGIIYEMSPQSVGHADLVMVLNRLITRALPDDCWVRPQLPFALSDHSLPEPDIVVVPNRPLGLGHPSRALWVLEVSASSLSFDRTFKMPLYAAGGVPECWIVNAEELQIEVHRDPAGTRYRSVQTYDRFARVAPLAFPELGVCLDELIGAAGA